VCVCVLASKGPERGKAAVGNARFMLCVAASKNIFARASWGVSCRCCCVTGNVQTSTMASNVKAHSTTSLVQLGALLSALCLTARQQHLEYYDSC
jgi:hypothetical protein